jgi:hypothetical protein
LKVGRFEEPQIRLFKIENSIVSCIKRSKKEVIKELSDSFIQYSEDESKLLIDNVIRSSLRPILFVEGPSDVSILNTAYKKLYPDEDISILIQDAFDRGFIKNLLKRLKNSPHKATPARHINPAEVPCYLPFIKQSRSSTTRSLKRQIQLLEIEQVRPNLRRNRNRNSFFS